MSGNEIRQKYIDFFVKQCGHAYIPSASLIPENDPTTLFTGSGMQPLVPYLLGQEHPKGPRLVNSQKCFRAEDIEEVGDNRHTTFFEMLGNWSLGDYFKKEQLSWFYSFLVDEIGLDPERIYVTVFSGDEENGVPKDAESVEIWEGLFKERKISYKVAEIGSEEDGGKKGTKDGERIFYYDASKNWWSRAGEPENMPVGEIGGPDSEVFYDFETEHDPAFGEHCHPNCDCGRFLEIGNSVFMEYIKTEKGFEKLPQKNVDFGGGLERIAAAKNDNPDIFNVDLLKVLLDSMEDSYGWNYAELDEEKKKVMRIVADHIRASVFLVSDGVRPSSSDQGYLLRRLLRRAIFKAYSFVPGFSNIYPLVPIVTNHYVSVFPELNKKVKEIQEVFEQEETAFVKTLQKGKKELDKLFPVGGFEFIPHGKDPEIGNKVDTKKAFFIYQTYGYPFELMQEELATRGYEIDEFQWRQELVRHQKLSRTGAEQKFKGGLADSSEKVTQYHTATHLLLAGLRHELGEDVHQAGSNITGERLRFDFTNNEKVDRETLDKVETYVNNAIHSGADVTVETIDKKQAESDTTIEGNFWERYPSEVNIYTITSSDGEIYSRELCGGPHVKNIEGLGTFKIVKEGSVAAGVRRIKATLE